jgi:tRNA pseudouridine55 synthase
MPSPESCGILNLNKPKGITSRRVVDRVHRLVRPAAAGHAGTLDPLATGVLVVGIGRATRLMEYVQRMPKHYRAGFRLGFTSDTDDVEGQIERVEVLRPPARAVIEEALADFIGEIEQRPPAFSAVRVGGRRAYQRARRGEPVDLKPRRVHVYDLKLVAFEYPSFELEIRCGRGTYVRAIGRDLGAKLGCGAVMESLVRTAIGTFRVEDAVEPMNLTRESLSDWLLPAARAVEALTNLTLAPDAIRRLAQGQPVSVPAVLPPETEEVAVLSEDGDLTAIARYDSPCGTLIPKLVLFGFGGGR